MKVAELFVNLGIQGSEKTIGALKSTMGGLSQTASMGLEAKAALVGVFYAMERLMTASGRQGTALTNTNALLGMSTKELQQYAWAAQQVGISNEEMSGTFNALQGKMTDVLLGKGAPEGMARVSMLVGGLDAKDIARFSKEPQELLKVLQQYALVEKDLGLRNKVLKGFGLSDNVIAGLARNAFRPEVMAKAPTYSGSEVKALDQVRAMWANLGTKIEMGVGKLNAKFGPELVKDLGAITDKVLALANVFGKLAEKVNLMEGLGKVFEGWGYIFEGIGLAVDKLSEFSVKPRFGEENKDPLAGVKLNPLVSDTKDRMIEALKRQVNAIPRDTMGRPVDQEKYRDLASSIARLQRTPAEQFPDARRRTKAEEPPIKVEPVVPSAAAVPERAAAPVIPINRGAGDGGTKQDISVTQTLNFQDGGTDPKATGDSVKKAVNDAFRQIGAQSQGN